MLEPLCKQVMCCVCPVSNSDASNMQMRTLGICRETTAFEYPGLTVNPGYIMSSVIQV